MDDWSWLVGTPVCSYCPGFFLYKCAEFKSGAFRAADDMLCLQGAFEWWKR